MMMEKWVWTTYTLLAKAYDSKPGNPDWNPLADTAPPYGIISLTDLVTMAAHYARHYPQRSGLKPTGSVKGNDSHLSSTIQYYSRLFHTIHAFTSQFQTWTKPNLELATEKKPKTPFSKKQQTGPFLSRSSRSESTRCSGKIE
jgi:hypothetical protein